MDMTHPENVIRDNDGNPANGRLLFAELEILAVEGNIQPELVFNHGLPDRDAARRVLARVLRSVANDLEEEG